MSLLQARQLLLRAARHYQQQRGTFSRQEIVAKINEIKYLSAQKKIPRLTLRKEILHLENKLQGVLEIEQQFRKQQQQESAKVKSLKQEITVLKRRLETAGNKNLHRKVERLTHLLGEQSARKQVRDEIALSTQNIAAHKKLPVQALPERERIERLQQRLSLLKSEVEIQKSLGNSTEDIEQKIALLEQKLQEYSSQSRGEIKHTLFFETPLPAAEFKKLDLEIEVERELPLPPPPRMRRKN